MERVMNTCGGCKHWDQASRDWQAEDAGMLRCAAVRTRWDIVDEGTQDLIANPPDEEEREEAFIAAGRNALRAAKAFVQDGSQYQASLWTGPDFSCCLFEAKE